MDKTLKNKDRTGGLRPATRHSFARAAKGCKSAFTWRWACALQSYRDLFAIILDLDVVPFGRQRWGPLERPLCDLPRCVTGFDFDLPSPSRVAEQNEINPDHEEKLSERSEFFSSLD